MDLDDFFAVSMVRSGMYTGVSVVSVSEISVPSGSSADTGWSCGPASGKEPDVVSAAGV